MSTSFRYAFNTSKWKPTTYPFQEALSYVKDEEEKKRVMKYYFDKDRKQALIGRLLIIYVCKQYFKDTNEEYTIKRTPQGRPYIHYKTKKERANFDINVSHHGDWVVIAAEKDCSVGCDLTKIETTNPDESVAEFFKSFQECFTHSEWDVIKLKTSLTPRPSSNEEKDKLSLAQFHRNWALKESYIKAVGIGLGFPLQSCQFNISTPLSFPEDVSFPSLYSKDTEVEIEGSKNKRWRFEETLLDSQHLVVVGLGPIDETIPDFRKTFPSQNSPNGDSKEEEIPPFNEKSAPFIVLNWVSLRRGLAE